MEPIENRSNRGEETVRERPGDHRRERRSTAGGPTSAAEKTPGEQRPSRGADADKNGGGAGRTDRASTETPNKTKRALDEELEKELEDSFPASDPPSLTEKPR